jgi:hypothetical protein
MDKIKKTKIGHKIVASGGTDSVDKTVAKITDTGNGYIVKFPAHSSMHQHYYVCLDYSQAAFLYRLLSEYKDELQ